MFPYQLTSALHAHHQPLFPPFHFSHWRAVDDRVRGGSSVSHLDPVEIDDKGRITTLEESEDVEVDEKRGKEGKIRAARFWGTLDIKTLGGAGFASQVYRYGPTPLHLPRTEYTGISLSVLPDPSIAATLDHSSPTEFTLVLKTSPTSHIPKHPKVPGPPRAAQLSYEASFELPKTNTYTYDEKSWSATTIKITEVIFDWNDFKATYRGREVKPGEERYVPLDTTGVYEISLMCRSGFGKQEGEFGLIVKSIDSVKKANTAASGGSWIWAWWTLLVGWVWSWIRWDRGIRLSDEEEGFVDEKEHL
ncbi:hypothetical protein CI109_102516 [Kwoniella shandongensis]|uniref:NADH:ubiquinone oxidoreductase intermediate-associated protein 30 domain-containing protein n=1 Tax=Kwoniella shandongensis TaxID=1734106 RepID=A0A5M6BZF8_9TREE|nr:uncharacterized protein CI109_003166 [Kwoniella shandongensis]KAA5528268.1 hypothetical protein CI109_003166 [Kwoniella shandongensis]